MRFARGCTPNTDEKRARARSPHELLMALGVVTAAPNEFSLSGFEAPVMDQGPTSGCTGHGSSQLTAVAFAAAGKPLSFVPSPGYFYKIARALERTDSSIPLVDQGAMPADLVTATSRWGMRPLSGHTPDGRYSDVTPENANVEPDPTEMQEAGENLLAGEYAIDAKASNAIATVCSCISKGVPVGIGAQVGSAFEQYDPAKGPVEHDPDDLGGHWIAVTYYYTLPSGVIVLGGPNSWGAQWPQTDASIEQIRETSPYWTPGHFEVTEGWFERQVFDCYPWPVTLTGEIT